MTEALFTHYMASIHAKSAIQNPHVPLAHIKECTFPHIPERFMGYPFEEDITHAFSSLERKALRSMSRSSIMLNAVSLPMRSILAHENMQRVGIYSAIENGAENYEAAWQIYQNNSHSSASLYKRHRNPKDYLKQLPNLAPAQLAIFLGLTGPMHVYTHSELGVRHALDHAAFDLSSGLIDRAIVNGAFSFEDPLVTMGKSLQLHPNQVLAEGAFCLLLNAGMIVNHEVNTQVHFGNITGIMNELIGRDRMKKSKEELYACVEEAIATVLNTDKAVMKQDSYLVADLGAESIDFLDISCEIEKTIQYEVDFKEIAKTTKSVNKGYDFTIGQIVDYIQLNMP